VLWFNKEAFDELLEWLLLAAAVQISADPGRAPDEAAKEIGACYGIVKKLQRAEKKSATRWRGCWRSPSKVSPCTWRPVRRNAMIYKLFGALYIGLFVGMFVLMSADVPAGLFLFFFVLRPCSAAVFVLDAAPPDCRGRVFCWRR